MQHLVNFEFEYGIPYMNNLLKLKQNHRKLYEIAITSEA